MEEPGYMSEVTGAKLRVEKDDFAQDNRDFGYDLSWKYKDRNTAGEAENFKNVLSTVVRSGHRRPKTELLIADVESYKTDEEIIQELKRTAIQHFAGRQANSEELHSEKYTDNMDEGQKTNSEIEKTAINDRLEKKSSHRWNKTKRKKLKKSREIMGTAIDKINELQNSDTLANSDVIGNKTGKNEDYKEKFNKYNEIYFAIYKSDCRLAEAVAKDENEEKIIKARAKRTYYRNMQNMTLREQLCYQEENNRLMDNKCKDRSEDETRTERLLRAEKVARVQERIDFYTAKYSEINDKMGRTLAEEDTLAEIINKKDAKTNKNKAKADKNKASDTYHIVDDKEAKEIAEGSREEQNQILFEQMQEEVRKNRLSISDWDSWGDRE